LTKSAYLFAKHVFLLFQFSLRIKYQHRGLRVISTKVEKSEQTLFLH